MNIEQAIARLHDQLPLRARQQALPPRAALVHRAILRSFIEHGRPLAANEIGRDAAAVLQRLSADDLVVLDRAGKEVVGAYPMTMETTPHRITAGGHHFYAMCALDALSISPVFGTQVRIESRCRLTDAPITIVQRGTQLEALRPDEQVCVGIRWQRPTGVAAHSMCREMVFLRDAQTAAVWQSGDTENSTVFALHDAIAFAAGFFRPLLEGESG